MSSSPFAAAARGARRAQFAGRDVQNCGHFGGTEPQRFQLGEGLMERRVGGVDLGLRGTAAGQRVGGGDDELLLAGASYRVVVR